MTDPVALGKRLNHDVRHDGDPLEPDDFIRSYEAALATQDWSQVEPLIHEEACVTFSNGTLHKGKEAVRAAFEGNFRAIKNEHYRISNVHWVLRAPRVAAYLFEFHWTGVIRGEPASGDGRGSCLLAREGSRWQMLMEQLSPRA